MKRPGNYKAVSMLLAAVLTASLYQPGSALAADTSAGAYDTSETAEVEVDLIKEIAADSVEEPDGEAPDSGEETNVVAEVNNGSTDEAAQEESEEEVKDEEEDSEEEAEATEEEGEEVKAAKEEVEDEMKTVAKEAEEDPEWFLPQLCETITVSGYYVYPGFSAYGLTDGVKVEEKEAEASDGTVFTKRFSAGSPAKDENGIPIFDSQRSMKIEVSELSNIVVYCQSSGSARTLRLVNKNGDTVKDFIAVSKDDPMAPSPAANVEKGVYYLFSPNSTVYTYGIRIRDGEAPRRDWSLVPDPVITSVTREENGDLTVTFDAEFGMDGADKGRIFMLRNGFEAGYQEVTSAKPAIFTPDSNGTYTFKVVIMRDGDADKESEEYVCDGYTMPPASPSITWLADLGGGSIYVDWNNVDADQGCSVYYKEESADDSAYTEAENGNKRGNCTITGLSTGKTYTVKVEANDSESGRSQYTRSITVGDASQEWYADTFGSATHGFIIVNGNENEVSSYSNQYPVSENRVEDVTNGNGTIVMDLRGNENGKIADSEEGVMVYYTRMNPRTENFKLTATFELTNSDIMGNQAGVGIYAFDIAGLGTKDAKYLNSVAVGNFKLSDGNETKYHHSGVRVVTGYESYDPTSTAGSGRDLDNTRVFSKKPEADVLVPGEKFTYTLEKTDTGFLCSYEGETFEIPGVNKLMEQEDGSIIVALAVGRCNGTISDIRFEKNPGTAASDTTVKETEPKVSVYSSDTTGEQEYLFMADSNVKGTITLSGNGKEFGTAQSGPDLVAKIETELWNPGGMNEMSYSFLPDETEPDLTGYEPVEGMLSVKWRVHGIAREVIYTSPDAPVNGQGTREDPVDLQTMLNSAMPGQTIIMLDGTYSPAEQYFIPRNVCGKDGEEITLMPENVGCVKVTGSNMDSPSLMHIVGNYWHIYGIEFCDGKNKGVSVSGNNNTVELCTMHDVGNSGLQISRYASEPYVQEMWPCNNLIKNCEAYNCCDPARNDADGFAAKLTCGEGNVFYGCISHHNIDDGWDLYAKSTTGPIGAVTVENCVAYSNGFLLGDDPSDSIVAFGEGNGFKLGGENMYGAHKLINSVSFNNYAKGITSNSGPNCQVINCTAYNNSLKGGSYNLSLYTKQSNEKAWVVDGVISLATNGTTAAELGSSNGVLYSLRSRTNYLFDGEKSENNQGVKATEDWFESTDVSIVPTRNPDGTINMHGLLVLKDNAPADSGARINTSSGAASEKPNSTGPVAGQESQRLVTIDIREEYIEDSLVDVVKQVSGAENAAQLESFMRSAVTNDERAKAVLDDVTKEDTSVYEVIVYVSFDGGDTWITADEETFPTSGVDLVFDYPDGTGAEEYAFVAAHLITKGINGRQQGEMEFLKPVGEEEGLKLHVDSVSPFAFGWKKSEETTAVEDPADDSNKNIGKTEGETDSAGGRKNGTRSGNKSGSGSASSGMSKTNGVRSGDGAPITETAAVIALAAAMIALILIQRIKINRK